MKQINMYTIFNNLVEILRSFSKTIFLGKIDLVKADKVQSDLLNKFLDFKKEIRQKNIEKKQKRNTVENIYALYEGREMVLKPFKSGMFPLKPTEVLGNLGMSD